MFEDKALRRMSAEQAVQPDRREARLRVNGTLCNQGSAGMTEGIDELWRQHRSGQDKYTYFLLAVAASAVAFAVQKTEGLPLSWQMTPIALAVLSWGCSFYAGCKNLIAVQTSLMANYNLLQLRHGVHPEQPNHPQLTAAAMSGVTSALQTNVNRAAFHAVWQFRLLVLGALLFIAWHVWRLAGNA
jgi:hypothetical protein